MTRQPRENRMRIRLQGQPAADLEEYAQRGNFRTTGAAAEHILNCFTGSMVRGLRQAQLAVQQSHGEFLPPDSVENQK